MSGAEQPGVQPKSFDARRSAAAVEEAAAGAARTIASARSEEEEVEQVVVGLPTAAPAETVQVDKAGEDTQTADIPDMDTAAADSLGTADIPREAVGADTAAAPVAPVEAAEGDIRPSVAGTHRARDTGPSAADSSQQAEAVEAAVLRAAATARVHSPPHRWAAVYRQPAPHNPDTPYTREGLRVYIVDRST